MYWGIVYFIGPIVGTLSFYLKRHQRHYIRWPIWRWSIWSRSRPGGRLFHSFLAQPYRQANCRLSCARGLSVTYEKMAVISNGHVYPQCIATQCQLIFRPTNHNLEWCQPIGCHVLHPTESPNATRLGLCNSLTWWQKWDIMGLIVCYHSHRGFLQGHHLPPMISCTKKKEHQERYSLVYGKGVCPINTTIFRKYGKLIKYPNMWSYFHNQIIHIKTISSRNMHVNNSFISLHYSQ